MVKKIDAYLLPWSFWKCQWRHWFRMVSFCLRHVVHLVTISSICFLRPGHHTESRTLSRNLRLPWCPAWILSRMSNRIYVGMRIVWSFRKTSLDSNNTPLEPIWFQWGVQFWLSGQPSVQNSNRFLHTSSFCWWSLNSSSFLSVAGKFSKMCETYTFHLLLKSFESFPAACSILNEYFISLTGNLWILGGSSSRVFEPKRGTSGFWSVSVRISLPRI